MRKILTSITRLGFGVAVAYFLDPNRGSQRRALARDKMFYILNKSRAAIETASRVFKNRATGLYLDIKAKSTDKNTTIDRILAEQIRSKVSGLVSNPEELIISVLDGTVTLRGPVMARDVMSLICGVSNIRGVLRVENNLDIQESADKSALKGKKVRQLKPSKKKRSDRRSNN